VTLWTDPSRCHGTLHDIQRDLYLVDQRIAQVQVPTEVAQKPRGIKIHLNNWKGSKRLWCWSGTHQLMLDIQDMWLSIRSVSWTVKTFAMVWRLWMAVLLQLSSQECQNLLRLWPLSNWGHAVVTMKAKDVEVNQTYILLVHICICMDVLDLPNVWIHEPVGFAVKHEGTFGIIMVTVNMFLHCDYQQFSLLSNQVGEGPLPQCTGHMLLLEMYLMLTHTIVIVFLGCVWWPHA